MSDKIIGLRSPAACPNIIQPQFFLDQTVVFVVSQQQSRPVSSSARTTHIIDGFFQVVSNKLATYTSTPTPPQCASNLLLCIRRRNTCCCSRRSSSSSHSFSHALKHIAVLVQLQVGYVVLFTIATTTKVLKKPLLFQRRAPSTSSVFFKLERKNGPCVCRLLEALFLQQFLNDVSDQHIHTPPRRQQALNFKCQFFFSLLKHLI